MSENYRVNTGYEDLEKWTYSEREYKMIVSTITRNKHIFSEQVIGSRKKIYLKGQFICTNPVESIHLGKIKNKQFSSFLGIFYKDMYHQFKLNESLHDLDVKPIGLYFRDTNLENYDKLQVDDIFWNIDLNSAYWQIAHRLGYISHNLFFKYMNNDDYKEAKRYCISFLARHNKMIYNTPISETETTKYEIYCNTTLFEKIFHNIRNELYNCIYNAMQDTLKNNSWIEYNIDGVTVLNRESLNQIKDKFIEMNLFFKSTLCTKINDLKYQYGNKSKNIRKKL